MHAGDLYKLWESPDNTRLTNKQFSFRLPVHVVAKIAALCEMYPKRSRTEIVGDLLSSALQELEKGLPVNKGEVIDEPMAGITVYSAWGPGVEFKRLANKYYQELEVELGNDRAPPLYTDFDTVADIDPSVR